MMRALLLPLTIALALLTAAALLLIAAAIVPPPLPAVVSSRSAQASEDHPTLAPASRTDTPLRDVGATALVRDAHAMVPSAPCIVELARLVYAPGSGGESRSLPGPLLLVVETGALLVRLDGPGTLLRFERPPLDMDGEFTLNVGDGLVLPAAAAAAFHNGGTTPVVALAAGVLSTGAPNRIPATTTSARWDESWSPGATAQPLAGGWLVDAPAGPAAIELGRLSLRPGARAPLISRGAIVVSVEAGALTMLTGHGLVWQQSPEDPDEWVEPARAAILLPRDGALLQDRPQLTVRNDGSGPLLVLVLTVEVAPIVTPPVETS